MTELPIMPEQLSVTDAKTIMERFDVPAVQLVDKALELYYDDRLSEYRDFRKALKSMYPTDLYGGADLVNIYLPNAKLREQTGREFRALYYGTIFQFKQNRGKYSHLFTVTIRGKDNELTVNTDPDNPTNFRDVITFMDNNS